ncbi:MAG: cytochrome oxidase Cu insertion factor (SCO1/SenC/PrrC family) [Planctomycetota bacterium]
MNGTLLGMTCGVVLGAAGLLVSNYAMRKPAWDLRVESIDEFPNVRLQSHDGEEFAFYDDLIKGKIVALNFMYTSCKGF